MYKRLTVIAVIGFVLGGCATGVKDVPDTPEGKVIAEDKIITIDPEALEEQMLGDKANTYVPTPDHVVVGEKDGVFVEVKKTETIHDEQADLDLQIWDAKATNTTGTNKCVTPLWRLMDFEYISDGPSEQYVRAHSTRTMGQMHQKIWILDGVPVAPPPSGYLNSMRVRNAHANAKEGEECMFLVDEDDIATEEDAIKDY